METSLIGKALGFGSNEYRFESCVSNINFNYTYSYVMNNINIKASHKTLKITIHYSRKAVLLLKALFLLGAINNYYFHLSQHNKKMLTIRPAYYNKLPLTKNFRILSTPSKTLFISYKALRLLKKRVGVASYIISTSYGLLTHREALKKKIGGILIGFFFI